MKNLLELGGTLFFVAGAQFIIGMIISEALYPGYSTPLNTISDLGATCKSSYIPWSNMVDWFW